VVLERSPEEGKSQALSRDALPRGSYAVARLQTERGWPRPGPGRGHRSASRHEPRPEQLRIQPAPALASQPAAAGV